MSSFKTIYHIDSSVKHNEHIRSRLVSKNYEKDKHQAVFDDEEMQENMAYLSSMPIGKRVFLSKYHDLVSPDKRNPYKENLRFEDREDVLENYN